MSGWKKVSKKEFYEFVKTIRVLKTFVWMPYIVYNDASDWRNVKEVGRIEIGSFWKSYWIKEEEDGKGV